MEKIFESLPESLSLRHIRANRIAKAALSYPPIRNLYLQAGRTPGYEGELGNYKIKFVSKTSTGFEASCNTDTRTIELLNNLSDKKALSYFVFELINAAQYPRHIENYNQFLISQDNLKYAKESERIEYENTIRHYRIIKAAGLDSDHIIWGERKLEDFEKVWINQLKNSSHAEYWRSIGTSLGNLAADSKKYKLPVIGILSLAIFGFGMWLKSRSSCKTLTIKPERK